MVLAIVGDYLLGFGIIGMCSHVCLYCHSCYIMDRFWSDGDKDRVVAKSPDRKTIKIAL